MYQFDMQDSFRKFSSLDRIIYFQEPRDVLTTRTVNDNKLNINSKIRSRMKYQLGLIDEELNHKLDAIKLLFTSKESDEIIGKGVWVESLSEDRLAIEFNPIIFILFYEWEEGLNLASDTIQSLVVFKNDDSILIEEPYQNELNIESIRKTRIDLKSLKINIFND